MSASVFARELRFRFSRDTLWPQVQRATAMMARQHRDWLIEDGDFSAHYRTIVNGVEGAAEETIRPNGTIIYRTRGIGMAVSFVLAYLRDHAPEQRARQTARHSTPLRFRDSFMVGISRGNEDGRAIPAASFSADRVSDDATEAYVYSSLPFSRLVDVQLEGGRRLKFSVEPGIYASAAQAARRAYPGIDAQRIYDIRHPARQRRKSDRRWIQYPGVVIRAG